MQGDDNVNTALTVDTSSQQTNVDDNPSSDEQLVDSQQVPVDNNIDEFSSSTPQEIEINVPVRNDPFPLQEDPQVNAEEVAQEDSKKMEELMAELQQLKQSKAK